MWKFAYFSHWQPSEYDDKKFEIPENEYRTFCWCNTSSVRQIGFCVWQRISTAFHIALKLSIFMFVCRPIFLRVYSIFFFEKFISTTTKSRKIGWHSIDVCSYGWATRILLILQYWFNFDYSIGISRSFSLCSLHSFFECSSGALLNIALLLSISLEIIIFVKIMCNYRDTGRLLLVHFILF